MYLILNQANTAYNDSMLFGAFIFSSDMDDEDLPEDEDDETPEDEDGPYYGDPDDSDDDYFEEKMDDILKNSGY